MPEAVLLPHRPLGPALRRWRALNRVKQAHAAELLGVAQSTVSRWESGAQEMEAAQRGRVEALVGARLTSSGDAALARLVREHGRGAHLICDGSHRLLALSQARRREFGCDADQLMGRSLYPFITEELARVETGLDELGWFDLASPPAVVAETGANGSDLVPIRPGRCRLTRMILSDGTAARLVETLT
jgi:transcriptional regulator with XRE-family HTH domain